MDNGNYEDSPSLDFDMPSYRQETESKETASTPISCPYRKCPAPADKQEQSFSLLLRSFHAQFLFFFKFL